MLRPPRFFCYPCSAIRPMLKETTAPGGPADFTSGSVGDLLIIRMELTFMAEGIDNSQPIV